MLFSHKRIIFPRDHVAVCNNTVLRTPPPPQDPGVETTVPVLWFPQSLGDPEQIQGDQVELSGGGLRQGKAGLLGEEH